MYKQESDWVQRVAVSSGAGWFPPATDWVAATHSRWDIPWNVYLQRCDSHLSVRAVSCFTPSLTLNIFSLSNSPKNRVMYCQEREAIISNWVNEKHLIIYRKYSMRIWI